MVQTCCATLDMSCTRHSAIASVLPQICHRTVSPFLSLLCSSSWQQRTDNRQGTEFFCLMSLQTHHHVLIHAPTRLSFSWEAATVQTIVFPVTLSGSSGCLGHLHDSQVSKKSRHSLAKVIRSDFSTLTFFNGTVPLLIMTLNPWSRGAQVPDTANLKDGVCVVVRRGFSGRTCGVPLSHEVLSRARLDEWRGGRNQSQGCFLLDLLRTFDGCHF